MASATQKVLGTTELLEAILLELPPFDLLMSQKVNKCFKATIERSLKIRQKLFFEARPGANIVNPFIVRVLRYFGIRWHPLVYGKSTPGYAPSHLRFEAAKSNSFLGFTGENIMVFDLIWPEHQITPASACHGSFRDMLICNPSMSEYIIRKNHNKEIWRTIEVETLGQLVAELAAGVD